MTDLRAPHPRRSGRDHIAVSPREVVKEAGRISHGEAVDRLLDATNAVMALLLRGEDVRKALQIIKGRERQ